jgi:transcriptional regulator with XRE-family HTH domain
MHVGKRIKEIRKLKNLNQKNVAIDSGYTQPYLSEIENSESCPTNTLEAITVKGLGVSMSYFYSPEDELYIYDNNNDNKIALLIKDIGMDYLVLGKELKEQSISPEELRKTLNNLRSLGLLNKE